VPPLEPHARRPQPIEQSTDFERVLRTRSRAQTQHFAVHHLPDRPSLSARARRAAVARRLSTGSAPEADKPVDDSPDQLWTGAVVPKRHARRAVTRSLLKRQIRSAVERHADNRRLTIVVDSGSYYWSSERQLDGQNGTNLKAAQEAWPRTIAFLKEHTK